MKRLSLILVTGLVAGLVAAVAARAATTYNDTVQAFRTAAAEAEGVAVLFEAAGDLPGMGKVTITRDGNNVTGGSWNMTVLPPNADAQTTERGRLSGSVTGGTLSFNADGTLAGVSAVQLTIEGGTGQLADARGTGVISVSASPEKPSQLTGTLVLNF